MVDRAARNRLAELARHLADGVSTNDEFEDRAEPVVRSSHGDAGVHVIFRDLWSLYSDFQEYRLKGRHCLSKDVKRDVARCVLFLHSDLEYEWPQHPNESWKGRLAYAVPFPWLIERIMRRATDEWKASGDFEVWPFLRLSDYQGALERPRLLSGEHRRP
jgi:hypothetical protein